MCLYVLCLFMEPMPSKTRIATGCYVYVFAASYDTWYLWLKLAESFSDIGDVDMPEY